MCIYKYVTNSNYSNNNRNGNNNSNIQKLEAR